MSTDAATLLDVIVSQYRFAEPGVGFFSPGRTDCDPFTCTHEFVILPSCDTAPDVSGLITSSQAVSTNAACR